MLTTPETLEPASVAAQLIGTPGASTPPPAAPIVASSDAGSDAVRSSPEASAGNGAPVPAANPYAHVVDKKNRPFDPLRHKMKNGAPFINADGYFMPIGGRKSASAAAAPVPAATPVPAMAGAPAPAALPASAAPAWTEAEKAAAATPVPEASAPGSAPAPASEAVQLVDYSNDAAKALSHGVFAFGGFIFDAREEVRPPKAEAEHLTEATAAWIRSTGWRGGPLAGMLLAWTAYALGLAEKPKISAKFREWFGSGPKPQKAVDIVATPVPPAAPKAAPVNPAAPVGFGGLRQG